MVRRWVVDMNITNPHGPNITILLPGGCNAKCDFCFWDRSFAKIKPPMDYSERVWSSIRSLPKDFRVISISGGEPTLSPWFTRILGGVTRFRRERVIDRVVLTTHGGNLVPHLPIIGCAIDHINISRHAVGTEANKSIFKTDKIPTDKELETTISRIHAETSCDVTLNCVVQPDVSAVFCYDFIKYAKSLGADAVSFRKVASDATPTDAEMAFSVAHGIQAQTKCPVCRGMSQLVDGFDVRWKGSVNEPSIETKGVYEVVIHPDGNAYADWGMKVPLELESCPPTRLKSTISRSTGYTSSGCGRGGGCG